MGNETGLNIPRFVFGPKTETPQIPPGSAARDWEPRSEVGSRNLLDMTV